MAREKRTNAWQSLDIDGKTSTSDYKTMRNKILSLKYLYESKLEGLVWRWFEVTS